MLLAIILFINYIAITTDAISDASVRRNKNVTWLEWHVVKWLRYFIPQFIIALLLFKCGLVEWSVDFVLGGIGYIALGWLLWRSFYRAGILD